MNNSIYTSLINIEKKVSEIEDKLSHLNYQNDLDEIKKLKKTFNEYYEIVKLFQKYKTNSLQIKNNQNELEQTKNSEFKKLLNEEINDLIKKNQILEAKLQLLLIPKDKNDEKNVIIEIRGAAGGEEANIFVGDLFKMYAKYIENNSWTLEIINCLESESGGYSQIEFLVKGKNVFSKLKYESGVHRVQRVPKTESKGRVHTSTATVAILPEASEIDVQINNKDLKIDTYRASGAGGQHVNKTDSAVRITHLPSGIVCASQDGRSQHDNKDKAMKLLYSKLYDKYLQEEENKLKDTRQKAIGKGDRSEKIRTYNYPQNRVTDHRIKLTINKLDSIMLGNLNIIINSLISYFKNEAIKSI